MKVIRTGLLAIVFLTLFGGGRVTLCDGLSWVGIDLHQHHCDEAADCDSSHDHEEEDCDCGGDTLLLQLTKAFPSLDSHPDEAPHLVSGEEFSFGPRANFAFLKVSHPPPLKSFGAASCILLQRFTI